jgi:hypothetical protein
MTDKATLARLARDARPGAATPAHRAYEPRLPVRVDLPGAKVMLLKGRYRGAEYVRVHVEHVLSRPADQGEAHVLRNLRCIRQNLEAIGVSQAEIDAEVRRIEGAVRAEIWRQVLGGDR